MTTSTPGRMPVIAFSDDADYDTLLALLSGVTGHRHLLWHGWAVALVLKDGTQNEVALVDTERPVDRIGGATFNDNSGLWDGPEVFVPIDDVVQIIVL